MKLCLLLLLLCLCCLGLTQELSTVPPDSRRAIGGAIERLGLKILEQLPVGPQQPNVIISPLSLALALAQLTLGARNETEKLLLESLHASELPCFHHTLGALVPHFRNTSLEVAARMYLRPGFKVELSFVEDSLARYQSSPVPLVSVEEVNQWVENATNGQINDFMESIPHSVVLMLINAVYFKGAWQTQFDPQVTSKGAFYLDHSNSVSVDMMKSPQYPLRLLNDQQLEAQVASFPFKGNTSFLIVMPLSGKGNVSSLLPKLNISDLYRRLPQEKTMQVNLPKLKLQYRQELQEALTNMGLGSLFSGPNLSGITSDPLRVTGVRHASTLELSEDGVEASATTAVTTMRSISLFSANSPFFFALVDDASLTPLFMGLVTNPAPDHMLNDDPGRNNGTESDQPEMEKLSPKQKLSDVDAAERGWKTRKHENQVQMFRRNSVCLQVSKMKQTTFLLVCGVAVSFCRAQSDSGGEEGGAEQEHVELFTTPATKMGAATSDFGYNLFRALAAREASTNIFLSPISVSAALTQLSMGGSERAERMLFRALRYNTLQDPQLHVTLKDLLASVRTPGKGLSTAARLYLSRRIRPKQDFFALVEQQYGVRPKTLAGGPKDVSEINTWVSQETGGKVQLLLAKPLPRNAGVHTVSASYFKGKWVTRFGQSGVMENFQVDGAAPVRVPMMQQDNYPVKIGADSDLSCTIAQIQMQDDISMYVFLPDDVTSNTTLLEESLTAEFVQDLSMTLLPVEVSLSLPALKLSFSTNLLPLLTDLGLSDWLADTDLEKISTQATKLGSVNHKVAMETAPEGNQYPRSGAPGHLTYRVDRPFLFLIRDEASGALLFIGRVEKLEKKKKKIFGSFRTTI
ncbi:Pigment epithelium-derived factor [Dissostichus eleginoides]|uniref:Pigment epithelium-derived factor n=1 Tax=Dissostichus eleginoides TaxID=100907 RepID=A0AAD9EQN2_DISEL|nr:Pigment epithelium-derived factor [Dissostichus eleginoides]